MGVADRPRATRAAPDAVGSRASTVGVRPMARLAARLPECGVPVEHLQLPLANHSFDLSWGAWSTQIAHAHLGAFLAQHLGRGDPVTH